MSMRYLLILLSLIAYTAVPARAQDRQENARRLLKDVRETERARSESAREWAQKRGLPTRIRQNDGRIIELVGVDNGRPIYLTATNRSAAAITGTSHLYPGARLELDLTGAGLLIGLWDEGHAFVNHLEIANRVTLGDKSEISAHATHVAGTLAASGVDDRARGMAYEALLKSYDWNSDATEMSNEAASGLLLSNHSYSTVGGWYYGDFENTGEEQWYWVGDPNVSTLEDVAFGRYDLASVQYDRVAYTNPYYLPVVAAGNDRLDTGPSSGTYRALDSRGDYQDYDVATRRIPMDGGDHGFDTITGASLAKNVLTIGSIGFSALSNTIHTSSFSSFGPTDDGRIKPDLVGLGEYVYSLSSDGTSRYARSSGTSMSTPNVTGSLLLLQQQYEEIYGAFMRAATLKGLALHTAKNLGGPGPDYQTGWGLLNTEAAARHISDSRSNAIAIHEDQLVDGASFGRRIVVKEAGPVRVTLSWTDHPSARLPMNGPSALDDPTPHLRNDLDVRLVNRATGAIYLPYVLDPRRPADQAATGDNRLDPIEQIFIVRADTGAYDLSVSHKDALYGGLPQPFSLVVSGAVDDSAPVAIARLASSVSLDGVRLTWSSLYERTTGAFIVERAPSNTAFTKSSADDSFIAVGRIDGGGMGADYEFFDPHSVSGRYTYRLLFETGEQLFEAGRTEVNLPAPNSYAILSSHPNPFSDRTSIELDLPKTQNVRIAVYDMLGRKMIKVHDGTLPAGRHRVPIDGGNWPPGVYFAHVETPNGTATHKMVLVR